MDLGLKDKVALVTAASKGLGKAAALELAREGAQVAVCARHETALNQTAEEIGQESGGLVLPIVADVSKAKDVKKLVGAVVERFGRLDIL
ncbi:MAG: 3-oxoacyl-ACP reductase, partial [Methanobacteriota archaeon]